MSLIESLEGRSLMSASFVPNPGSPQAAHSGNLVAIDSSQIIHNGQFVSQDASGGARAAGVQALLALSGRGSLG